MIFPSGKSHFRLQTKQKPHYALASASEARAVIELESIRPLLQTEKGQHKMNSPILLI